VAEVVLEELAEGVAAFLTDRVRQRLTSGTFCVLILDGLRIPTAEPSARTHQRFPERRLDDQPVALPDWR
jgi:hypothetical protein